MYAFSPSAYWISARRAERFGSYSMPSTVAGTPVFVALEVDVAIALLVTAAERKRDVIRPWLLRPAVRGLVLEQALLGLALGDLAEVLRRHAATARATSACNSDRHGLDALEELDVVAGLERDERLLPRRARPENRPTRFSLPRTTSVRTSVTVTLNSVWTARADLDLVRVASDLEHDLLRVVLALGGRGGARRRSREGAPSSR